MGVEIGLEIIVEVYIKIKSIYVFWFSSLFLEIILYRKLFKCKRVLL